MKNRRFWSAVLAIALCVSCFALLSNEAHAAELASGTCGDNLAWVLTDDGVLTISGTGEMYNYDSGGNPAPWAAYQDKITSVIVESGVTTIGSKAFYYCQRLTTVKIKEGVTEIYAGAFFDCSNLVSIDLPDSLTTIGTDAFRYCRSLKSIVIPDKVRRIADETFYGCSSLSVVVLPKKIYEIAGGAFSNCTSLWHVLYKGSEYKWDEIVIATHRGDSSSILKSAKRHYNCTGNEVVDLANKVCTLCCKHSWGNGTTTKAPTCTEEGQKSYTCSKCSKAKTEAVEAMGHDYSSEITAPTCTEQGYTTYTCARCDHTHVDDYTDVIDHSWDNGVVTKEPTETAVGERLYTCGSCGLTRTDEIPVLESVPTEPSEPIPTNPIEQGPTNPEHTTPSTHPSTEPSAPSDSEAPADNIDPTMIIVIIVAMIAVGGGAAFVLLKKK